MWKWLLSGGLALLALRVCAGVWPDRPEDLSVKAEIQLRERFKGKAQRVAEQDPEVLKKKQKIEEMSTPYKVGSEVTVQKLIYGTKQIRTYTGKLYRVEERTVEVGRHELYISRLHPDDQLRIAGINNPKKLKKHVAGLRNELVALVKRKAKNHVDEQMHRHGYSPEFYKNYVNTGDVYRSRISLGDRESRVWTLQQEDPLDQVPSTVDVMLSYGGKLPLAAVLLIDGQPVLSAGSVTERGKIKPELWPKNQAGRQSQRVRLLLEQLNGVSAADLLAQKGRLLFCAEDVGVWELLPQFPHTPKVTESKEVPCPDCGGSGFTSGKGANLEHVAKAYLEAIQAGPKVFLEAEAIIKKYEKGEIDKQVECKTCQNGKVRLLKPVLVKQNRAIFKLPDNVQPQHFKRDEATLKDFVKLHRAAPDTGKLEELQQQKQKEVAAHHGEALTARGMKEIKALAAEWLTVFKKRRFELTQELYDWYTLAEIIKNRDAESPGAQMCRLSGHEDAGYAPTTIMKQPVRRMTKWRPLRFDSVDTHDYAANLAHYRIVEIGGNPDVDKAPPPEKEAPKGEMPGMDWRQRQTKDKPDEPTEIPNDLEERRYVLQFAVRFTSLTPAKYSIAVNADVNLNPIETDFDDVTFKLPKADRSIIYAHKYKVEGMWRGDLIATTPLSFEQMASWIRKKNIELKVRVQKE